MVFGVFLLLCGLALPARALPPFGDCGTNAAQDGTGTVWALPPDYNSEGKLLRWQAGDWIVETVPSAAGLHAQALARGGNGLFYVFWRAYSSGQIPAPQSLVTTHHGRVSRLLARLPQETVQDFASSRVPLLCADAAGGVWLAGNQSLLQHILPDGTVTEFPLKPEQGFDRNQPVSTLRVTASLGDAAGQRWFWEAKTASEWNPNGLRGVLIWNGKAMAYHPTLTGVPDRPFSVIVPLDASHVWLATSGDYFGRSPTGPGMTHGGLYRVDTRSVTAEAVTPPPSGAFQNIIQVFQVHGDCYVVDRQQFGPGAALWRLRAGQWHKCLDRVQDAWGYYGSAARYPWLSEPSGLWLGAGGGAWWLPCNDTAPVWVNWRRGLTALNITSLFPLKSGSLLAVGSQGAAEMPPLPQPLRPLPPNLIAGGMGAPKNLGWLLADPRHHLWGTPTSYSGPCPLIEWDGKRWQMHPVPKEAEGVNGLYACDTLGRLWLTTSVWHPPAQPQPVEGRVVYDPVRDVWTVYKTVPNALQAAAALPGMGFLPFRNLYEPPLFSSDGHVAYAANADISFYDGNAWHHWKASDILPGYSYGNLGSPPHFNPLGRLEVALAEGSPNKPLWEWTPESGWQRTGERGPDVYVDPVPPNGPRGLWGNPAADSSGRKWFVWQNAVYTAFQGLWVKQADLSGSGSPFYSRYNIEDVLRDPLGRFFFVSRPAGFYDFVVWSPPPVLKLTLSIVPIAEDAVQVRINSPLQGLHWFQWRLNGGPWSKPQTENTVMLTSLLHGNYRLEAQALDHRLLLSPVTVAAFSIRVEQSAQIAHWVRALLSGTDDQREAAVAGLVKQPGAALPALRAAQSGASEASRWWLDAAIQEVTAQTDSHR